MTVLELVLRTLLRGDTGGASVVRAHGRAGAVQELHLDDPGIAADIDTLEHLAQAEMRLSSQLPIHHPGSVKEQSHGKH
jgi:molybdenum cofactor cytidylyltransferase